MKGLSLVIPTYNEEGNVVSLVKRTATALKKQNIPFELIFIDDHSSDKTVEVIKSLATTYPIKLHLKRGKKGKAFSLLEGFEKAGFDTLGFIDADLQYPPEAIPKMMEKLARGADIVVAQRETRHDLIRTFISKSFMNIFVRKLHKLNVDSQSGLKVFKKEVYQKITLHPSAWTLDLELLVKAKALGFSIETVDIVFSQRTYGESKVSLKTIFELGISAIKLKFTTPRFSPGSKGEGFYYKGRLFMPHTTLRRGETAFYRLTPNQLVYIIPFLLLLALLFRNNWHFTLVAVISILTIFYFFDLLFDLFLVVRTFKSKPELQVSKEEMEKVPYPAWPKVSIFCPLYKEWQVLSQFISAIEKINYPKNKLQVLLLLEEDDTDTITRVKSFDLPDYFEAIVVPHGQPKTKPKACNFGLKRATGEYLVIYDAEDVPESDQIKKAMVAFSKLPPNVACIQAKLNFYNPNQNLLTKLFTAEYSLWFDLLLTGLQSLQAPIPLGGTSNYFKTSNLKMLKGWDAFNVTEDCDLGIRLSKLGFVTAIIESTTNEEANSSLPNWFRQRTRWIKGYIQTYLVHTRDLSNYIKDYGLINFLIFQTIVGGKVLSMFINPLMWLLTISYFLLRAHIGKTIESFFPLPILYIGVLSLLLGNFLYMYYYMLSLAKKGFFGLIKYCFIVPFYWVAMSIAAFAALYKLIVEPYFWSKTIHGLHIRKTSEDDFEKIYTINPEIISLKAGTTI